MFLLYSDPLHGLALDLGKRLVFWRFEHGFDLIESLFEKLEILEHHGYEVGLRHGVEGCGVHRILLHDGMEEAKSVVSLREAVLANHSLVDLICESENFLLQSSSPHDAVLSLLLDVLSWHVCCII